MHNLSKKSNAVLASNARVGSLRESSEDRRSVSEKVLSATERDVKDRKGNLISDVLSQNVLRKNGELKHIPLVPAPTAEVYRLMNRERGPKPYSRRNR